ncbi:hypothetical protein predicted by Glimmer/Critica [Erwinia amylovora CFBP1430]|uniref:Uncharacterized protein n=1 Tax=Erwinia amylovora (strain CFBP1430) TaxID=665029 RepID=D4I1X7_ERWAC|nr:hypothetical protein predicted by Glimmer/Critica [Erwinia amylovora CFBP1430]
MWPNDGYRTSGNPSDHHGRWQNPEYHPADIAAKNSMLPMWRSKQVMIRE